MRFQYGKQRFKSTLLCMLVMACTAGCSGGGGLGSSSSGGGGIAGITSASSASLSTNAQAALAALNESPTYQITSADLNALETSGALTTAQVGELRTELGL